MRSLLFGLLLIVGLGIGFFAYYYWLNHDELVEKTVFLPNEDLSAVVSDLDESTIENSTNNSLVEEIGIDLELEQKTINEMSADKNNVDFNDVPNDKVVDEINNIILPTEFKLKVAFSTQAPTENWGMPYQEACEEASLIMAYYYFTNKPLSRPIMNEEILKLVEWEKQTFGYYEHSTLEETAKIATEYFNLDVEISENVMIDNLKNQLYAGNLVILPFAGRLLENPYFSGEGPLYHMAVLKGWDSKNFIMNDPGLLRLGENFKYSYENLIESIHDWDDENILNGRKAILIVKGLKK